ncbi:hypothetical protein CANARDRAFT_218032 [[Candida] arabinofermentans NRRL YB-2248]|uniref:uridine/cytidine kinase n=1 Tax=[Candida] arabinofermentans NRRL YB-2248 TaxID=983967 RepID=A0A1E4T4E4_9ASCO|nr:hypothetical protein CANARDRAFT_218032 [[Candida] arabinofermentans NRRL YB-2248]
MSNSSSASVNASASTDLEATRYIPPWSSPYIIGVAGFSGSGKTTVAQKIIEEINEPWTVLVSMDNFYKPLTKAQSELAFQDSLKAGKKTEIPVYSFSLHDRTEEKITIYGANVVILEGIYSLFDQSLLDMMDAKIYVDTDLDICYTRRLMRDIAERGRDLGGIIRQWDSYVKPNSVRFVKPTMSNADVIIPRGSDNKVAIDMIIKHLKKQLKLKSIEHLHHLKKLGRVIKPIDFSKVDVLKETNQLLGIKSIMLNSATSNDEFIFYFNRIASLLINQSLELVEYGPSINKIVSPTGHILKDAIQQKQEVVAVNIIRSGDCFVYSLRKTIPEVVIGKLLIQSDSQTGEPQLHTERLPSFSNNCKVLLFDAQIISGAAVIMAIKVILDNGVEEKNLVLVTYLATEVAVRRVLNAFPEVHLVIGNMSSIEGIEGKDMDGDWWMSNRFIDSRYFGTD